MALQFQPPPDWLMQEYQKRQNENPVVDTLNAGASIAKDYQARKQQQQAAMLAQEKVDMAKRAQFYNYGDIASLPRQDQQGILNPAVGPSMPVPVEQQRMNQLGGAEGPTTPEQISPQKSPIIQHYQSFLAQNPQGIKGQSVTEDPIYEADPDTGELVQTGTSKRMSKGKTIISKGKGSFDQKKTFQEKQDVYDGTGKPIGYQTFDTRTGEKQFHSYDASGMPANSTFGPKVKPEIPSGAVEKTAAQVGFLDLLKNVRDNYDPKFVGPLDARFRDVKQKVDMPSIGLGATKEAADFVRPLADLRSAIVNERTGAAVGERQEWDRLLELIPDDKKSDPDFKAKMDSIETRYKQIIQNRASAFGSAGYRNQGSAPAPSGPSVGTVKNGYKFKGGNPADKASWVKQ